MIVVPSWWRKGTVKELEEDLGNYFKFKGIGIYQTEADTDVSLIVPFPLGEVVNWDAEFPEDQKFMFYNWNCKSEESILSLLNNSIPIRELNNDSE